MAAVSLSHYRRAVVAALAPHLAPQALEKAVHAVTTQKPGNSISEIIAYVDHLAGQGVVDTSQCKRLYGELFLHLGKPENTLPPDPLVNGQATPGILRPTPVAPGIPAVMSAMPPAPLRRNPPTSTVTAVPVTTTTPPQTPAGVAPVATSAVAPAPKAPTTPVLPPAEAVFVALVSHAHTSLQQFHHGQLAEFSSDLALVCKRDKAVHGASFLQAWQEESALSHWVHGKSIPECSALLHCFYTALCETLGPVGADQLLTRAVQAAGQIPAAAQFSPGRLL
jgi:hypothetical protein